MDSRPYPADSSPSTLGQPSYDPLPDHQHSHLPPPQAHSSVHQHHSRFDSLDSRSGPSYASSSSHPSSFTPSSEDHSRVPNWYRQQQQYQQQQQHRHQQQEQQQYYSPHDQQQLPQQRQMDIDTSPYGSGKHTLNNDFTTWPHHHTIAPTSHESPLSSRTGHSETHALSDSRRTHPSAPSHSLHSHRSPPPPQHSPLPFSPAGGPTPLDRERELENSRLGGRGYTGHHPEESLHVLSSLAHQQQQQQQQQQHYTHQSQQQQQREQHYLGEPQRERQQEHLSMIARDRSHNAAVTGSQERTLPLIQLKITDSANQDVVDRALGRASSTISTSVHHDNIANNNNNNNNDNNNTSSLYNITYSEEYPYRPRLEQDHSQEGAYYYGDLPDVRQDDFHSDRRSFPTSHHTNYHHYPRNMQQQQNQQQYQSHPQFESQDRPREPEPTE
ncbi:hypothetical protein BGX26_006046, partial [Mortierella sp. AD094]